MTLTVRRFAYPWHLALLSRALGPLSRTRSVGSLAPIDIARSAFGAIGEELPSDAERARWLGPEFDDSMELLCRTNFPPLGKVHWRAVLVSAARARIGLERYLASGAPVGKVKDPVFVVGLPRTGTSLVQRLLAEDETRRGLHTYELLSPLPARSRWERVKQRALGHLSSIIYRIVTPELNKIHHTSATSLEECWMLFMPSYSVLNADYIFPAPAFGDSLLFGDMGPSYRRYAQQLGILSLSAPERTFVLKCPEHLWFLSELLEEFPTARVIWTHRDPAKAVPSYAAQVSLLGRQHNGAIDPKAVGERVRTRFHQGVERGTATCERARAGEFPGARITHLPYSELTADPARAIRRCYEDLGLEVTDRHDQRMRAFLAGPQHDKNQNRYDASVYGFTAEGLRSEFADYMQRYGIEPERSREALVSVPVSLSPSPTR